MNDFFLFFLNARRRDWNSNLLKVGGTKKLPLRDWYYYIYETFRWTFIFLRQPFTIYGHKKERRILSKIPLIRWSSPAKILKPTILRHFDRQFNNELQFDRQFEKKLTDKLICNTVLNIFYTNDILIKNMTFDRQKNIGWNFDRQIYINYSLEYILLDWPFDKQKNH